MREIEEAKKYILENNKEKAKAILEDLKVTGMVDKEIYLELGKCYLNEDKMKAIENIEKYIELGGKGIEIKVLLAKLYKETGNIRKSREVLENEEPNEEGLIELFRINVITNEKEKAKKNIEKIEKIYGKIKEPEEVAQEYIKWKEYKELKEILIRNKNNISKKKYHYYMFICKKELKEKGIIKEIELLRENKEYEKEIKESLIKESKQDFSYKEGEEVYNIIELLCKYIEEDDTDSDVIRALALILRKNILSKVVKERIIEILKRYKQASKKIRAGNIFLNEIEILEKKTILKSKPRHVTVQLTTKCNLKCPMCWVYKNNFVISSKVFSFIKLTIPYLESVIWQGGEVFLYDNFDELMELAAINKVRQTILTNGLLLNDNRIKLLSKYNIKIKISIDAVDKLNYEQIRVGGKFENLLNILEKLKLEKKKNKSFGYLMAVVINSLNYDKIDDMVDFAIKYNFECITFQNFIINSVFQDASLLLDIQKAEEVLEKIKFLKKQSEEGKINIKIETNFSIKDISDLLSSYRDFKSIQYGFKSITKGHYSFSYIKKDYMGCIQHKYGDSLNNYKLSCLNACGISNKFNPLYCEQLLFCVSPWTKVYLDINNVMRSSCNGYAFDISQCLDDIWNNRKLVEYRKDIVCGNIKDCKVICRNNGEYSEKTLLGVV